MAVSIQQASLNALATWISAQVGGDITVAPRWPSADRKLPPKAVTIIPAGKRIDTHLDVRMLKTVPQIDDLTTITTWQVKMCELPIQIDVWANTDPARDDILAQLDIALNAGEAALGGFNPDPANSGVLVNVGDGWSSTTADFTFDGPEVVSDDDAALRSEFRATILGTAYMMLTVDKLSAKQKVVTFLLNLQNS